MTASPICVAPLALLWTVRGGDITHLIVVVTVRVDGAVNIAGVWVDTVKAGGAIGVGAFCLTFRVLTTLRSGIHLIANNIGAVNISRPVTNWTIRVLVAHIELKGPSSLTLGVLIKLVLTICTLHKAGFPLRTALPESAAVYQGKERIESVPI